MDAVALVLPAGSSRFSDAFFAELIAAVGGALAERELDFLISAPRSDEDEVSALRRVTDGSRVDGVIVPRTLWEDARVDYLLDKNIPFVTHGRTSRAAEHAWHDVDGEQAMVEATQRLIDFGHRRIGFMNAPIEYAFSRAREAGYRKAMEAAGLEVRVDWSYRVAGTPEAGRSAGRCIMSKAESPTAILCATDRIAWGVLEAIRERELTPGRDVSVIGYDDLSASAHQSPPLTTMRQPIHEEGEVLVSMLLDVIGGRPPTELQQLTQATLIARASDGPAPV